MMARWCAVVLGLLCLAGASRASIGSEEGSPAVLPDLTGSVRAGLVSTLPDFAQPRGAVPASLWLQAAGQPSPGASYRLDGWLGARDLRHAGGEGGRLREALVQFRGDAWDLRVGKQLITWGRADRFNPTDNLSPRDYRLFAPEEADQREGVMALNLARQAGDTRWSVIWLYPRLQPHRLPLPPGLPTQEPPVYGAQGAIKIDHAGGRADWSLSYFDGLDLTPGLAPDPSVSGVVRLTHGRVRVLGADGATVLGRYGLRAEAAYTWADAHHDGPGPRKQDFVYVVSGIERTLDADVNINLQAYYRRVMHHRAALDTTDPALRLLAEQSDVLWNQRQREQFGFTARLARRWLNETLEAELAALVSMTRHEWMLRPRVAYAVTDHLKVTIGADLYRGTADSFFGSLRDLSTAFVEARYGF